MESLVTHTGAAMTLDARNAQALEDAAIGAHSGDVADAYRAITAMVVG